MGDVKYLDLNDDGQITDIDRDYCGSPWAKMQMSLVLNAEWKNFDFSMMWNGQFGNKIYNVSRWQGRLFADNSNYIRFEKGEEPYQVNPNSNTHVSFTVTSATRVMPTVSWRMVLTSV